MGHGSDEIVIGFSTGNTMIHHSTEDLSIVSSIREEHLNLPFRAIGEAVEEAILNSMLCASSVTGYQGNKRESLADFMYLLKDE